MHFCSVASAIVCGAVSFSSGVTVEQFSSTIVGSEIFYQCQPGFLPEGRRTVLCGGDGRWNPDPRDLCTGNAFCLSFHSFDLTSYFCYFLFQFQTKVSPKQLLQPLQLLSAHWWHSLLGPCVVHWSLSASAGGKRKDMVLSQHQTHKNISKQL